jgi:hypothetical protein
MELIEKLGYIGSMVNAVAMVGSVAYLALQVRQANRLARLSAIDALRDATNQFREILLAQGNVDVWLKGIEKPDEMTDAERFRWNELALYLWDSTQATYLRAIHLREEFAVRRIGYTVRYASGGVRFQGWWNERRERFHPDFVRFVDDNLGKPLESVGEHPPPRRRRNQAAEPG